MLTKIGTAVFAIAIIVAGSTATVLPAYAEGCVSQGNSSREGKYGGATVSVGVSCTSTSQGSDSQGTGSVPQKPVICRDKSGNEVPCAKNGRTWNTALQTWCKPVAAPAGASGGNWVDCDLTCGFIQLPDKAKAPVSESPTITPTQLAREAVASIGLHAATIGIGAWEDPEYPAYGVTWWVGAPLWLWIDATDHEAWGTHTLQASEGGLTITGTVKPTKVTFTMGDDTGQVTCGNPGTPRPFNPRDLMADESPSGCQYRYPHTNTQGDPNSRYTISGAVTWTITWATTTGATGTFTLDIPTTTTEVHIGEIRITRG